MGEVNVEVLLRSNGRSRRKRLLVDTGATFSWISETDLRALGIRPTDTEQFETIEGKMTRRKVGVVDVRILGRRVPTVVVFARKRDSEVLGLHALERAHPPGMPGGYEAPPDSCLLPTAYCLTD